MLLHRFLSLERMDTPLDISPMMLSMVRSLCVFHSFGRFLGGVPVISLLCSRSLSLDSYSSVVCLFCKLGFWDANY